MRDRSRHVWAAAIIATVLVTMVISCQSNTTVDPRKQAVINETEELFTRSKVLDYEVLFENEYPYMRDEAELEGYLTHRILQWGRVDTLAALQIDSVTLFDDSAYAHLQIEYLLSDSSLKIRSIPLFWYSIGDTDWVHPTLSHLNRQLEYEEEIRVYWEAVRAMEQERQADDTTVDDSE